MKPSHGLLLSFLLISLSGLHAQTVTFSKTRGFNTGNFSLTLTTDLSGGTIKYTTDGTAPSATIGNAYSAPIAISNTTVVRAIAISGAASTKVFTHSYIFPSKVKSQKATIAGWPNKKYALGDGTDSVVHDYEMDPDVVNDPAYSADITNSLKSIPSLSIVMDRTQFWEMYDDPFGDIERPASVEYLDPKNSALHEQFDCNIEGHSWLRLKRSMHLSFDDPGLNTKIFKNAPLNGATSREHFDDRKIVLRAGNNDAWNRNWNTNNTTYTRDEWYRASQLAVNGYGSHGTFVHLYVNGIYWGLYNPVERPDDGFAAEYFGGSKNDWLDIDQSGIKGSGDPTRYNFLMDSLTTKNMADTTNYKKLKQYLDVSTFADYMIICWIPGMGDWPGNNYYGANRNSPQEPFRYFAWDAEWSWTSHHGANDGAWVSPYFTIPITNNLSIPRIWKAAKANPDFMILFADRVYKNCFNGGAMTDSSSRARWATINNFINTAIIAESARWGDAVNDGIIRTKNGYWLPEVNRIDGLMNGNVTRFINALRAQGYYPALNPPNFNREGGHSLSVFQLTMANTNGLGTIYYTINSTDPRLPGGALSPDALVYSTSITINSAKTIKARVKNGNDWSALHEGAYAIYNLKINEFMANNTGNIVDENGELEDWIELYNNTSLAVNIGGMYMTDLLTNKTLWQIPKKDPSATTIPPYGYKLLWADQDTSDGILHVNFQLTSAGEQIGIAVKSGASVVYLDSLVFTSQQANASRGRYPDGSTTMQKFTSPTPGQSNLLPITGLFINEFLASNQTDTVDEFGQHDDWFEIYNNNTTAINVGGLFVTDNLSMLTKYQIPTTNPPATTIPAKGFLLLWADQELTQGPLHVDFKLGNSGEQLGIAQQFGNTLTIIDSLSFGAQLANVSKGRLPNGTSTFAYFTTTTPGASNQLFNVVDCNGILNGTAALDGCGVCSGGNTGHVANSDKDACGICFGNGSSCSPTCVYNEVVSFTIMRTGTAGEYGPLTNGTIINLAVTPQFSVRANVCDSPVGSVKFIVNGSTVRTETTPPYAINGDSPTGSYLAWNVGVGSYTLTGTPYSGAGGSGTAGVSETVTFTVINQSGNVDCNGVPNGSATIDDCGVCAEGNTGKIPNANKDCNGVCFGTAIIDGCGVCAGGTTGKVPNANKDCNGVCFGTALPDNCGICSGGNTGHVANSDKDSCGVCFGNGSTCGPTCVHNEVVSFTIMRLGTAGEYGPLTNGTVINLAVTPQFSIRANVCDSPVGSVKFLLNGSTFRVETTPPYSINGDSPAGSFLAWNASIGSYTLEGRPYSGASGTGTVGISEIVSFTVINQSGTPDCNGVPGGTAAIDDCGVCAGGNTGKVPNANKDCNGVCFGTAALDGCGICSGGNTGHVANSDKDACGVCFGNGAPCTTCVHNEVVSFTLMHTGTAGEIGSLTNGMTINKAATGPFSIRANVCDSPVGSMRFILNGTTFRTETTPPYAINGDTPTGSYTAWNPNPGSYTLEGKPFSGASGSGTAGISEIVSFTVVNAAAKMDNGSEESFKFSIYPNPNSGSFVVEAFHESVSNLTLRVYNTLGQVIYTASQTEISGNYSKQITLNNLASGIYYVEMAWGEEVMREKVVVE